MAAAGLRRRGAERPGTSPVPPPPAPFPQGCPRPPPGSCHVSVRVRLTPTRQIPPTPASPPRAIWGMHAPAPRVYTAAPSRGAFLWMALADEPGEVGAPRRAAPAAGYKSLRARGRQRQASGRGPPEDGGRLPPPALGGAAPAGPLAPFLLPARGPARCCPDGPALGPQPCALLEAVGGRAGGGGPAERPRPRSGEWGAAEHLPPASPRSRPGNPGGTGMLGEGPVPRWRADLCSLLCSLAAPAGWLKPPESWRSTRTPSGKWQSPAAAGSRGGPRRTRGPWCCAARRVPCSPL